MLYWFVVVILLIAVNILQLYLHYREKSQIFDRYMSKDLEEYKHFQEIFPKEVKHREEVFKDYQKNKKRKMTETERKIKEAANRF